MNNLDNLDKDDTNLIEIENKEGKNKPKQTAERCS